MEFLVLEPVKKRGTFGAGRLKTISWDVPLFYEENRTNDWQFPTKEQHLQHLEEFKIWFPEIVSWVDSNNGILIHTEWHNWLNGGTWTKGLVSFPKKKDAKNFLEKWGEHLSLWLHIFKHRCGINSHTFGSKYSNIFNVRMEGIYETRTTTIENEDGQQEWIDVPKLSGEQIQNIFNIFKYKERKQFLTNEVYDWLKNTKSPFIKDTYNDDLYFMDAQDATFFKLRWK